MFKILFVVVDPRDGELHELEFGDKFPTLDAALKKGHELTKKEADFFRVEKEKEVVRDDRQINMF